MSKTHLVELRNTLKHDKAMSDDELFAKFAALWADGIDYEIEKFIVAGRVELFWRKGTPL